MASLTLTVLPQTLAVCQLKPGEEIPNRVYAGSFWSITRSESEVSIVLPESEVPPGWKQSAPWRGLRVEGPLDFSLVGILAGLSSVLAQAEVSLFALSTYDTDYLLVRAADLDKALAALAGAGYQLQVAPPGTE